MSTISPLRIKSLLRTFFLAAALLTIAATDAYAQSGRWSPLTTANASSTLTYTAEAPILRKPGKFIVSFYCNPYNGKNSSGAIGFNLTVAHATTLTPFNFDDFEGPDATAAAKQLVEVIVKRGGKTTFTMKESASGSYQENEAFMFGVSKLNKVARSNVKTLLRELAAGADSLQITITDSRNAAIKLLFEVPVHGKQAEFSKLLINLK